jgi:Homocysteine S-methyltransferase
MLLPSNLLERRALSHFCAPAPWVHWKRIASRSMYSTRRCKRAPKDLETEDGKDSRREIPAPASPARWPEVPNRRRYRNLPHLSRRLESPHGRSLHPAGKRARTKRLARIFRSLRLAVDRGVGFILESPTWRANPDWGAKIGVDRHRLAEVNRATVDLMHEIRARYETERTPLVISGCIGPRGDGYAPGPLMSPGEAEAYHGWQISLFRDCGCDFVSAITMTNINEGIGVARAAQATDMPCVISFTLETDGRLPTNWA